MKRYQIPLSTLTRLKKRLFPLPIGMKGIKFGTLDTKRIMMYEYNGRSLLFDASTNAIAGFTAGFIKENYEGEQYKIFDVKDKAVIDIGSGTADTCIYFILHGAKEVYGYEPNRERHESGLKNIELNNMKNKIMLYNEGGNLEKALSRIQGNDIALKLDCEGCEYDILKHDLSRISSIFIEYHHGKQDLIATLENAGFKVKEIMPERKYAKYSKGLYKVGTMYATKQKANIILEV